MRRSIPLIWQLPSLRGLRHRPMMRIGRAAAAWDRIACDDGEWREAVDRLRERAQAADATSLFIYPGHPHRNGAAARQPAGDAADRAQWKNQAPECAAVRAGGSEARLAWAGVAGLSRRVAHAGGRCIHRRLPSRPALLRHANETWPMEAVGATLRQSLEMPRGRRKRPLTYRAKMRTISVILN